MAHLLLEPNKIKNIKKNQNYLGLHILLDLGNFFETEKKN